MLVTYTTFYKRLKCKGNPKDGKKEIFPTKKTEEQSKLKANLTGLFLKLRTKRV